MKNAFYIIMTTLSMNSMAHAYSQDVNDGQPYWIRSDNDQIFCGTLSLSGAMTEAGINACRTHRGSYISYDSDVKFCGEWTNQDGWLIAKVPLFRCKK